MIGDCLEASLTFFFIIISLIYFNVIEIGLSSPQQITYIHTYIIGHYNPSVRIIDQASHITYVVCVHFIHKWWNLQFKVESERQIFEKLLHSNFYLLSEFFVRRLLRGSRQRYISNKPIHYQLV